MIFCRDFCSCVCLFGLFLHAFFVVLCDMVSAFLKSHEFVSGSLVVDALWAVFPYVFFFSKNDICLKNVFSTKLLFFCVFPPFLSPWDRPKNG